MPRSPTLFIAVTAFLFMGCPLPEEPTSTDHNASPAPEEQSIHQGERSLPIAEAARATGDSFAQEDESAKPREAAPETESRTVSRVCIITADFLGLQRSEVLPGTSMADLGCDDLDTVELVMEYEHYFDIYLPEEDLIAIAGHNWLSQGGNKFTMSALAQLIDKRRVIEGKLPGNEEEAEEELSEN